jgi:glycoside/pentoside/hexuronide:cation symporter, GPH family
MARPMAAPAGAPVRGPQLSAWLKLVYGFGDLVLAVRQTVFQFAMLPFFTDVVLLAPWLAGAAKMVGLVWDGVNDPITGYLSDGTRSRLGRRRPYMLGAAVPMGLTFALMWLVPPGMGQLASFLCLVAAYLVLDTCFTLYATPYLALGAELSEDYHERTQLSATRAFFHVVGLFLGATAPFAILARYGNDPATGYALMGIGVGAFMMVVALITGTLVRERPVTASAQPAERPSWRAFATGQLATLRNRPFRIMLATFAVLQIGGGIYQSMVPYAFQYWLGRRELIGQVLAIYMGCFIVSLPLWTWLARRLGKDRALKLCMLWGATSLAVVPVAFSPDMSAQRMGAFLVLAGLGNGGWAVLPVAITADIVDTDELETYRRREGAYFGMWMLALKLATGLASGIVGLGLQLVGYVPNAVQTDGAILGIKLLYGPIPAVFLLLGLALFYRFPLTRERHAEVQAALAARRG